MRKLNQLRAVLEQSNPYFKQNPDRLQLYIDGGQIISTGAASLSFEYVYTLNIIVTDYAADIAHLIVPIIAYLRENQPENFENPSRRENAFKYQLDYNNNNTVDVSFEIAMTERVVGRLETNYNGEQSVYMSYENEPSGLTVASSLNRLKVTLAENDEVIFKVGDDPVKAGGQPSSA